MQEETDIGDRCKQITTTLMQLMSTHTHTHTVLWPFFRDHPGEPVPEKNFWTSWCKGRLTEADTPTIRLGTTPSRLTTAHLHHPPICNSCLKKEKSYWPSSIRCNECLAVAYHRPLFERYPGLVPEPFEGLPSTITPIYYRYWVP